MGNRADVLITSYPERWNTTPGHSQFFDMLRKMVEKRPRQRFGSKRLFHKIVEESLKFQAHIPSDLLETGESSKGSHNSSSPMQKPVDTVTYLKVFSREVMRIVSF
jgi:hypothetical protein